MVGILVLSQHSAFERLAELFIQRRHTVRPTALRFYGRLLWDLSFVPGAIARLCSRCCAVELRHEPLESVEIVEQPAFRVFVGVIEDADGPAVGACADEAQQLHILGADAEREDFPALGFAANVHAVQVEEQEVRQHPREHLFEPVEVTVAMM